jgi:predicted DNA-binding protein (MmcQ/YjbR family)
MTTQQIADHCRSLAYARGEMKWGNDLVFTIGGKMFAVLEMTDEPFGRFSFKCTQGQFEALSRCEGIIPASYMARAQWVSVTAPDAISLEDALAFIEESYEMVKAKLPKKVQAELTGA